MSAGGDGGGRRVHRPIRHRVASGTEQSRRLSIEALLQRLDKDTPHPRPLMCPAGELMFVFVVDFHRRPRAVCTQMGFEYAHLEFVDVLSDSYTAVNETSFAGNYWARVFLILWCQAIFATAHSS